MTENELGCGSWNLTACGQTEFLRKDGLRIRDFASDNEELRKCGEIDYEIRSDGDFRRDKVFRGSENSPKSGQRRVILKQERHTQGRTYHGRNDVQGMTSEVRMVSEHDRIRT